MSKKIDFGEDEVFIKNYQELKSSRKMGELYNCSKKTILNHAKKIKFDVNKIPRNFKLNEEDKERIKSLYNEKTSNELAKEYNVSRGMITKIWYDSKLIGKEISNNISEIDMTGQKIGKWTVLFKTNKRNTGGVIY